MEQKSMVKKLKRTQKLLKILGIHRKHLLRPILLDVLSSIASALSAVFVVFLIQGVVRHEFVFSGRAYYLKPIFEKLSFDIEASFASSFMAVLTIAFGAAMLSQLLKYLSASDASKIARKMSSSLRKKIFKRYMYFGKMYFDLHHYSELSTVLTLVPTRFKQNIRVAISAISGCLTLGIYFLMMLILQWKLTLLVLLYFPIFIYAQHYINKQIKYLSKKEFQDQQNINKRIFNILTNIPLVKAYVKEEDERSSFNQLTDTADVTGYRADVKMNQSGPIENLLMLSLLLISIGTSVMFTFSGGIAGMLLYIFLLRQNTQKLFALTRFNLVLSRMTVEGQKILNIFSNNNKYPVLGGNQKSFKFQKQIEIRNLSFSYKNRRPILKKISTKIEKGKITAIVGNTGSGKSTLMSLLMRFYDCSPGTILIDGVDIRNIDVHSLRSNIAYISQNDFLMNDTIEANILYGIEGVSEDALFDVIDQARLGFWIVKLPRGLKTVVGDHGVQLSGGEKQRIAIARALLKNTPILIMDEPVSALDSKTEDALFESLQKTLQGKTVITVTHRLSTIRNAEKVIVLENGLVAEEGTISELLDRRGPFRDYWDRQKNHFRNRDEINFENIAGEFYSDREERKSYGLSKTFGEQIDFSNRMNHYSSDEKRQIVLEGLQGDRSINEICSKYSISSETYYCWRNMFFKYGKGASK